MLGVVGGFLCKYFFQRSELFLISVPHQRTHATLEFAAILEYRVSNATASFLRETFLMAALLAWRVPPITFSVGRIYFLDQQCANSILQCIVISFEFGSFYK
jgi:hypothetical protein